MAMTAAQLEQALIQQQQINRRLRADNTRLEKLLAPPTQDEQEVFNHWQAVMRKPRATLTAERRRAIRKARREHSYQDCIRAIDGNAAAGFTDERGVRHNELELIMRKIELNLERWEALQRGLRTANGKAGAVEDTVRALRRMAAQP